MELLSDNVKEIVALKQNTLDELWHEAEGLGRVSAERDYSDEVYKVIIAFTRKSGTRIYAEGKDQTIAFALANAINEAREMGAF